jgi:hypothetical protein
MAFKNPINALEVTTDGSHLQCTEQKNIAGIKMSQVTIKY